MGKRERQTTLQTCIPLLRFFKRVQAAASRDRPRSRCIQVRREPFTCARIMRWAQWNCDRDHLPSSCEINANVNTVARMEFIKLGDNASIRECMLEHM